MGFFSWRNLLLKKRLFISYTSIEVSYWKKLIKALFEVNWKYNPLNRYFKSIYNTSCLFWAFHTQKPKCIMSGGEFCYCLEMDRLERVEGQCAEPLCEMAISLWSLPYGVASLFLSTRQNWQLQSSHCRCLLSLSIGAWFWPVWQRWQKEKFLALYDPIYDAVDVTEACNCHDHLCHLILRWRKMKWKYSISLAIIVLSQVVQ